MNRTIKFRAWIGNEYMSYSHTNKGLGYLEFNSNGSIVIGEDDGDQRHENIPLMQFTGLLDRTGKEIYEGDILLLPLDFKGVVKYKDGSFIIENTNNKFYYLHDFVSHLIYEIIGNIHETPELI